MSLFTAIVHPETGEEIQFNTGYDRLDNYRHKVGDDVPWHIDEKSPGDGHLLDGVYQAYGSLGPNCYWVIIKDHKVHSVIDDPEHQFYEDYLIRKHGICPYERSWWTEAQWVEKDIEEAEFEIEILQERLEFNRSLRGKSDDEIKTIKEEYLAKSFSKALWNTLQSESLTRQIFTIKEVVDNENG